MEGCVMGTLLLALLLLAAQRLSCLRTPTSNSALPGPLTPHNNLSTPWADNLTNIPWANVYPRPTLQRDIWMNLNGPWAFSLTDFENLPGFTDSILVPFCAESMLSGLETDVNYNDRMWYRRVFTVPASWTGRVILNFEAVDYETFVFINNAFIGSHKGGFDRFSFDITNYLSGLKDIIVLKINDPTHINAIANGKQMRYEHLPGDIFYTPVSGVWQTVWLEPVPATYIESLKITPSVDSSSVTFDVKLNGTATKKGVTTVYQVTIKVKTGGSEVGRVTISDVTQSGSGSAILTLNNPRLWSPKDPFLYDVEATLDSGDRVTSYFGMRKIGLETVNGFQRFFLNNQELPFQIGPLDQGFWPDGIYTPPSLEAVEWDLNAIKNLGFNMVRKHIKVEPEVWYHTADKLGLLVWQDFPSILNNKIQTHEENKLQFLVEIQEWMNQMYNHPSIILWVVFNEAWGQHDTESVTTFAQSRDKTRIFTDASGWVHHNAGQVLDIHCYPGPICGSAATPETNRALVLGEFWGRKITIEGHKWFPQRESKGETEEEYIAHYNAAVTQLLQMEKGGYSAAVVTQTTDVEGELNGFYTYDRKVAKVNLTRIADLNSLLTTDKTTRLLDINKQQQQRQANNNQWNWFQANQVPAVP